MSLISIVRREAAQRYRSDDAVRVVVCDSSLRAAWSDLTMAQRWGHDYSQVVHHVEVRQLLNAEAFDKSVLASFKSQVSNPTL